MEVDAVRRGSRQERAPGVVHGVLPNIGVPAIGEFAGRADGDFEEAGCDGKGCRGGSYAAVPDVARVPHQIEGFGPRHRFLAGCL